MTTTQIILALLGSFLGGGVVFKVLLDRFSMTKNEQYHALIMLIEQLQKNVNENNDEISELKKDVREWREKYYKEVDEKNKVSLEVNKLRLELQKFNNQHNK